jgi:hypothetical protein
VHKPHASKDYSIFVIRKKKTIASCKKVVIFSTILLSWNKPATSNHLAVLFSQNKPTPATSQMSTLKQSYNLIDVFSQQLDNRMPLLTSDAALSAIL